MTAVTLPDLAAGRPRLDLAAELPDKAAPIKRVTIDSGRASRTETHRVLAHDAPCMDQSGKDVCDLERSFLGEKILRDAADFSASVRGRLFLDEPRFEFATARGNRCEKAILAGSKQPRYSGLCVLVSLSQVSTALFSFRASRASLTKKLDRYRDLAPSARRSGQRRGNRRGRMVSRISRKRRPASRLPSARWKESP